MTHPIRLCQRLVVRRAFLVTLVFASVASPRAGAAQTSITAWTGLDTTHLQTVFVRERSGVETRGRLLSLGDESLSLLVDGREQRFARADVDRIQRRDTLRNGALIGTIVGLVMGTLTAGIAECPGAMQASSCGGGRAALMLVSVGTYAAIGTGIDAMIPGRSTLYAAPGGVRRVQVGLGW